MLDNLTFSQRRVHTVGVGVLLSAVRRELAAAPSLLVLLAFRHSVLRRRAARGANLLQKQASLGPAKSWKAVMTRAGDLRGPKKKLFC